MANEMRRQAKAAKVEPESNEESKDKLEQESSSSPTEATEQVKNVERDSMTALFLKHYYVEDLMLGTGGWGEVHPCRLRAQGPKATWRACKMYCRRKKKETTVSPRDDSENRPAPRLSIPNTLHDIDEAVYYREQYILRRLMVKPYEHVGSDYEFYHPNIVQHLAVYHTSLQAEVAAFYVFELIDGPNLWEFANKHKEGLSETESVAIYKQVFGAVAYVHSKGIVHADLKPDNIMIATLNPLLVKLIDFNGACDLMMQPPYPQMWGTVGYQAPEMFTGVRYSYPVDMWALGVTLIETVTKDLIMFDDSKREVVNNNTSQAEVNFLVERALCSNKCSAMSENFKDLARRCLRVKASKRVSALEALTHPFFSAGLTQPSSAQVNNDTVSTNSEDTGDIDTAIEAPVVTQVGEVSAPSNVELNMSRSTVSFSPNDKSTAEAATAIEENSIKGVLESMAALFGNCCALWR